VSTFNAWRRFAALSVTEQSVVLQAAVWLSATWFGLRVCGFRRWQNFLAKFASDAPQSAAPDCDLLPQAFQTARLHAAAARHIFLHTNCLERALVLAFLLRCRGIAADLRFGARKEAARLEAHAWVEYRGVPLDEDLGEHRHFLPFEGLKPLLETLPD
jgi:transglutaminase superfamily protein